MVDKHDQASMTKPVTSMAKLADHHDQYDLGIAGDHQSTSWVVSMTKMVDKRDQHDQASQPSWSSGSCWQPR